MEYQQFINWLKYRKLYNQFKKHFEEFDEDGACKFFPYHKSFEDAFNTYKETFLLRLANAKHTTLKKKISWLCIALTFESYYKHYFS